MGNWGPFDLVVNGILLCGSLRSIYRYYRFKRTFSLYWAIICAAYWCVQFSYISFGYLYNRSIVLTFISIQVLTIILCFIKGVHWFIKEKTVEMYPKILFALIGSFLGVLLLLVLVGFIHSNDTVNRETYFELLYTILAVIIIFGSYIMTYLDELIRGELSIKGRYELAIEGANQNIWEYDLIQQTGNFTQDFMKKLGVKGNENINPIEVWKACVHPDDLKELLMEINQCGENASKYFEKSYRITYVTGEERWILTKCRVVYDALGKPTKLVGVHEDITDEKEIEEHKNYIMEHDELTGLLNRKAFMQRFEQEIQNGALNNKNVAIFIMDFDNFKLLNDTFGYEYGDLFLCNITKKLQEELDQNSLMARLGGDEFIILKKGIDIEEVTVFCERILNMVDSPWSLDEYEQDVTVSIGVSVYPKDGNYAEELLKRAEMAISKAKKEGKNQFVFFQPSMKEEIRKRMRMLKQLKKAVEQHQIQVYFQPQLEVMSENVCGVEALVRWMLPTGEVIPPSEFIPLAEETGLIIPIGEYIFEKAIIQCKEIVENFNQSIKISVNVSSIQLRHKNFVAIFKEIIERVGLNPDYIILEITESVLMEALDTTVKKLQELREIGIRIALDDFGTGYSSLNYLVELPIDIVKIDRSFIDNIGEDEKKKDIVSLIVDLAHHLDIVVVAEGVESKEQYEILKSQNCDKIQGYFFSKPLKYYDLLEYLTLKVETEAV